MILGFLFNFWDKFIIYILFDNLRFSFQTTLIPWHPSPPRCPPGNLHRPEQNFQNLSSRPSIPNNNIRLIKFHGLDLGKS